MSAVYLGYSVSTVDYSELLWGIARVVNVALVIFHFELQICDF